MPRIKYKSGAASKRLGALMTLTLLVSGCVSGGVSEGALAGFCKGLEPRVVAHARTLAAEGSVATVLTGDSLIAGIDAGCAK